MYYLELVTIDSDCKDRFFVGPFYSEADRDKFSEVSDRIADFCARRYKVNPNAYKRIPYDSIPDGNYHISRFIHNPVPDLPYQPLLFWLKQEGAD